jgi:hypothetical protein
MSMSDQELKDELDHHTVRMILAVAARESLVLRQFDVRLLTSCNSSFLDRELEEKEFITAPACSEHFAGGPAKVLRLQCTLHGLFQTPRTWSKRIETELSSRGSDAHPAL